MKFFNHLHLLWKNSPGNVRKRILAIFTVLIFFNIVIWVSGFLFARVHPLLLGWIAIAYGLGLRHAVDADHIAAIDNTTRKLMIDNKKPVAVGLFFSLGHSTIVIILSILVTVFSLFIKNSLPYLEARGAVIGTSVSSFFLLLISLINLIAFFDILRIFKTVTKSKNYNKKLVEKQLQSGGFLSRIFSPILKIVTASWQMYIVGFLFGLGFDTASEVGLLSISAVSSSTGISFVEILLLPLAFTAGMALIDTLDGILMLGAYGWAYIQPARKLYYNLNITLVSVIIALFIGGTEALQLLSAEFNLHNQYFKLINALDLGKLGYITIIIFAVSWVISYIIFKLKQYDKVL